jgi:hypothetical protein
VDRDGIGAVRARQAVDHRQGPLEAGPWRPGTRRDDDKIRSGVDHVIGGRLGPEPNVHPEGGQAPLEPGDEVEDLASRWLATGQPELPAELVAPLEQRHPMTALGCCSRRFQTGRPAADHENRSRCLRRLEPIAAPQELPAGGGIDQAGDPVIA